MRDVLFFIHALRYASATVKNKCVKSFQREVRDYIDFAFDATKEADLRGGLQILTFMTLLAEDLLSAGKNDEVLSKNR